MKIFIAPWGNPFGWKEVEYSYKGKTKRAKDPLPLIKEEENPEKIIIVCVDTLSDDCIYSLKDPSYIGIKNISENRICNFCEKEFKFTPDKVVISYGFGEFNNTKFEGNAMDFYYKVFQEFSFYFADLLNEMKEENEKIEVIFDATHGINYTTILTYRALREILEILAYVYEVKLKVLNSDPYIGREVESNKLNINVIEESKILPRISVYDTDKRPIKPYFDLVDEEKGKLGKNIQDFLNQINYNEHKILIFLGSFLYALPVFILSYILNSQIIKGKVEKILSRFEENISIDRESKLKILRKYEFGENFSNLMKAFLISSVLEKFGFEKLCDIPLSKIQELKEKIFKNHPVESNRIDKEIGDIKELQNINQTYQVYSVLKGGTISNQIDKRNFFAHAGFEYNTLELKKENNEIYVRIYEKNKGKAEGLIIDDLPKL